MLKLAYIIESLNESPKKVTHHSYLKENIKCWQINSVLQMKSYSSIAATTARFYH